MTMALTAAAEEGQMTDEGEIRDVLERYGRGLNSGDADLVMSCYAADAIFMPTALPTVAGAALRGWYTKFFEATKMDVTFTIDEVVLSGTLAYAVTRSHGTQTALAKDTASPESNREVFIFAREDGAWKISRYLFNKPQ
jgi:uncharacterized protein (TIGR02246 family)